VALACGSAAAADLYRYVDARGVVHFTATPRDARYRKVRVEPVVAPGGLRIFAPAGKGWTPTLRGYGHGRRRQEPEHFDELIRSASRSHAVPAALVKAVIAAESSFDEGAVSPKGAMGLMQLMPGTAEELGVADAFHAAQNVHGGTRYLRELHDRYGDWLRTLAAYNAGPEAVDRYEGVPPYAETREYVRRVLSYYRRFHADFAR
jgi:hypothetical protein